MRRLIPVAFLLLIAARVATAQATAEPEPAGFVEGRVVAATTAAPSPAPASAPTTRPSFPTRRGATASRCRRGAGSWRLAWPAISPTHGRSSCARRDPARGPLPLEQTRIEEVVEVVAEASDDSEEPSTLPVRPAEVMQLAGAGRTSSHPPDPAGRGGCRGVRQPSGGPWRRPGPEPDGPRRRRGPQPVPAVRLTSAFNPETSSASS